MPPPMAVSIPYGSQALETRLNRGFGVIMISDLLLDGVCASCS